VHDSLLLSAKELSPGDVLNISVVVCNMGRGAGRRWSSCSRPKGQMPPTPGG
jgi:hypothetical protein